MTVVWLALRRAAVAMPMLFGIATVTFLVTHILPGDPIRALAGQFATPELLGQLRHQYGLDKSLPAQYWSYISHIVRLDFGTSIRTGASVREDLQHLFPSTLELIVLSLLVSLSIGVPMGAMAALKRGTPTDKGARTFNSALLAVPDFWLALVAIYILFFKLGVAPAPVGQLGITDARPPDVTGAMLIDSVIAWNGTAFGSAAYHAMLPVLTLGIVLSAPLARLMRSAMIEALEADYVRFGRACGLPARVLWRYAARAAIPSVVTMTGMLCTSLLGGAIIVETIFSWGGAAQYAGAAIQEGDYNAIQGFVLVAGVISVVVFFLVDVAYIVIDPRVRLGRVSVVGSRSERRKASRALAAEESVSPL